MTGIVSTSQGKSIKFNGSTCRVIAILDALRRSRNPLRIDDIIGMTTDDGVMMKGGNQRAEASNILSRLKGVGAVYNPSGVQAPTHQYCLARGVKVEVAF